MHSEWAEEESQANSGSPLVAAAIKALENIYVDV